MDVTRIVSGGQTGADRAALDVALALGLQYGGWCPPGGWAEDLPSPPGLLDRYPALRETPPGARSVRTRWNVWDSDATLVLTLGGTATDPSAISAWLTTLAGPITLNVAGPRESKAPGLYVAAYRTLTELWSC